MNHLDPARSTRRRARELAGDLVAITAAVVVVAAIAGARALFRRRLR